MRQSVLLVTVMCKTVYGARVTVGCKIGTICGIGVTVKCIIEANQNRN
jgi:hypothetical protein